MKKIIVGIIAILLIAWSIEKIANYFNPIGPDFDQFAIDALYKSKLTRNKLGELKSYDMHYDSLTKDDSFLKFTISVQGSKGSGRWKGEMYKQEDKNYVVSKLVVDTTHSD